MASHEKDDSNDRASKKIKLSEEKEVPESQKAEDLSSHSRINSFNGFTFKQILSENAKSKSLFLEGSFDPGDDPAVVVLEKSPIEKDSIEKLLNTADFALNLKTYLVPQPNVVDYACYPTIARGDMKATIICPATPKHVKKYNFQPSYIVKETPDTYKNIVLPHLESQKFSLQWVYNILEHKSEVERILFEDSNPELGFVLLPDLKWDEGEKSSIYLIAICHSKNIKSLRDLDASHLPLLENVKTKSLDAISEKYKITPEKLRIFIHYQPSYYHLHVHFTSIHQCMPGIQFERAHLLDTVMNNLELLPSYYQDTTLTYTLKETDPLFVKLKEADVVSL